MKQYYIIRNDQQAGPYTLEELTTMSMPPDTMVWTEGMTDWQPARQLSELNALFAPPVQTPPSHTAPSYGAPSAPQYHGAPQYNSAPRYNTPSERPPMPPNYLAWSIVVTLLCCLIGGIIAIVYSSQVSSRYMEGDYEGAADSSRKARTWIIVSACVGGFFSIIYALWLFFFAAAAATSEVFYL